MKVAILVNKFPPKWLAGTEIATYDLAGHLAKRGHQVHVITSLDEGLPTLSEENGFYIHRIEPPSVPLFGIIIFWMRMFNIVHKINPDVVHSQSLSFGVPSLAIKKIQEIPYIIWGRGSDVYLPDRVIRLTIGSILRNADMSLALTYEMKSKMQKRCIKDVEVISNGINLEMYENIWEKDENRVENTIIFVGRLHPVKGVHYLIKAMDKVRGTIPNARLIIVGDGEERLRLENQVEELNLNGYVTFMGQLRRDMIPTTLRMAQIFILPSLSEGFPVVLLEAMASGLPIITTNVGGIPEIIEDEMNGYLVCPKDHDQLADRIITLLQNDSLRQSISYNNLKKARSFSWNNVSEKVEKAYKRVINSQ